MSPVSKCCPFSLPVLTLNPGPLRDPQGGFPGCGLHAADPHRLLQRRRGEPLLRRRASLQAPCRTRRLPTDQRRLHACSEPGFAAYLPAAYTRPASRPRCELGPHPAARCRGAARAARPDLWERSCVTTGEPWTEPPYRLQAILRSSSRICVAAGRARTCGCGWRRRRSSRSRSACWCSCRRRPCRTSRAR